MPTDRWENVYSAFFFEEESLAKYREKLLGEKLLGVKFLEGKASVINLPTNPDVHKFPEIIVIPDFQENYEILDFPDILEIGDILDLPDKYPGLP